MIQEVISKPTSCPRCGGNVYRVLYGEQICSEEEYFKQNGERVIFGGYCLLLDKPDYQCEYCGTEFLEISFPPNAKELVKEVAFNENPDCTELLYEGLHNQKMVFSTNSNDAKLGIETQLYFVNSQGYVTGRKSKRNFYILEKLRQRKLKEKIHDTAFFNRVAKRMLRDKIYYDNARRIGDYNGKRAYKPFFSRKYKEEPPTLKAYPVILIDKDGNAEWVNFQTSAIYNLIRRKCSNAFISSFLYKE